MRNAAVGSVILLASAAAGAASAEPVLSIDGQCPGLITVSWEGATPDALAGLAYGHEIGSSLIYEPCAGTVIDLSVGIRLVGHGRTGPDGRGSVDVQARPAGCGGYLQMVVVDGFPCTTSNVVRIPE